MLQLTIREREAQRVEQAVGEEVSKFLKETGGIYLCGGALTSVFSKSKINDFDFYFRSSSQFIKFKSFMERLGSEFSLVSQTNNALTYSAVGVKNKDFLKKFQLIIKPAVYEKPMEQVLNAFDFSVCQAGYDFTRRIFSLHENFVYDLSRKDLIINPKTLHPLNTLVRLKKYLDRGFTIAPKEIVKLAMLINKLDLSSKQVVMDNLGGLGSGEIKVVTDKLSTGDEVNVEEVLSEFLEKDY